MDAREIALEMAVRAAKRVVEKVYEWNDEDSLDDSRFAPLVRCIADAVERQALDEGFSRDTAAKATTEIKEFGIQLYVDLCRRNVPDEADEKEDRETFEYLMKHGKWPRY